MTKTGLYTVQLEDGYWDLVQIDEDGNDLGIASHTFLGLTAETATKSEARAYVLKHMWRFVDDSNLR